MAIIRGDGGVTVTGRESGSGKATYVPTSAPKSSTSSSSSEASSSRQASDNPSHDRDSDSRARVQARLENLEQVASYDPSYRQTIAYQDTRRDLSQRTGSPKTFEDYAPGQTPFEQLQNKEGDFYESSQRGLRRPASRTTDA